MSEKGYILQNSLCKKVIFEKQCSVAVSDYQTYLKKEPFKVVNEKLWSMRKVFSFVKLHGKLLTKTSRNLQIAGYFLALVYLRLKTSALW